MELEALYEGVPDDSVNLTFRHLTDVNLQPNSSFEKKRSKIPSDNERQSTPLTKLPSLDFNRALQAASQQSRPDAKIRLHPSAHPKPEGVDLVDVGRVLEYSDRGLSSMYEHHRATPGRRRPGIPHSNICTNCSTYIYIFRHRCLVLKIKSNQLFISKLKHKSIQLMFNLAGVWKSLL